MAPQRILFLTRLSTALRCLVWCRMSTTTQSNTPSLSFTPSTVCSDTTETILFSYILPHRPTHPACLSLCPLSVQTQQKLYCSVTYYHTDQHTQLVFHSVHCLFRHNRNYTVQLLTTTQANTPSLSFTPSTVCSDTTETILFSYILPHRPTHPACLSLCPLSVQTQQKLYCSVTYYHTGQHTQLVFHSIHCLFRHNRNYTVQLHTTTQTNTPSLSFTLSTVCSDTTETILFSYILPHRPTHPACLSLHPLSVQTQQKLLFSYILPHRPTHPACLSLHPLSAWDTTETILFTVTYYHTDQHTQLVLHSVHCLFRHNRNYTVQLLTTTQANTPSLSFTPSAVCLVMTESIFFTMISASPLCPKHSLCFALFTLSWSDWKQ